LREWLLAEPFSLGLSSGFFGFFAHAGFVSALEEAGLRPNRIAGASAGGLVGALWASGLEAARIRDELVGLRRQDFWDPFPGLGLLRGRLFRRRLEGLVPVQTFEECPIELVLSACDLVTRRPLVLDSGPLAPAIHASCAVPFLFQPVWIGWRPLCDGGVVDRPGLAGLVPGGRLLFHHLASRSPWRRRGSPALEPPIRPQTVCVIIDGLPRLGPFRLERATEAFEIARQTTLRALEQPVEGGLIRLPGSRD
jgi:NTE family protein